MGMALINRNVGVHDLFCALCTKKSQTLLSVQAIIGPTQFSLKACVVMVVAASTYKCYLISLRGFPTRQMIRYGTRASSPAKIDDSMLDDRQLYLYQDNVLAGLYQSKVSYY